MPQMFEEDVSTLSHASSKVRLLFVYTLGCLLGFIGQESEPDSTVAKVTVELLSSGRAVIGAVGQTMEQRKPAAPSSKPESAKCANCGNPGSLRCGACKAVSYCSTSCQRVRMLRAARAMPALFRNSCACPHSCTGKSHTRKLALVLQKESEKWWFKLLIYNDSKLLFLF